VLLAHAATTFFSMPANICAATPGVMKLNTTMLSPIRLRISGRDSRYLK